MEWRALKDATFFVFTWIGYILVFCLALGILGFLIFKASVWIGGLLPFWQENPHDAGGVGFLIVFAIVVIVIAIFVKYQEFKRWW